MGKYKKAWVPIVTALLASIGQVIADGGVTTAELKWLGLGVITSIAVWWTKNVPADPNPPA